MRTKRGRFFFPFTFTFWHIYYLNKCALDKINEQNQYTQWQFYFCSKPSTNNLYISFSQHISLFFMTRDFLNIDRNTFWTDKSGLVYVSLDFFLRFRFRFLAESGTDLWAGLCFVIRPSLLSSSPSDEELWPTWPCLFIFLFKSTSPLSERKLILKVSLGYTI